MENSGIHHYTFHIIPLYTFLYSNWSNGVSSFFWCVKNSWFSWDDLGSPGPPWSIPCAFWSWRSWSKAGRYSDHLRSHFSIDSGEMCANAGISPQMLETFSQILGVLPCFSQKCGFCFCFCRDLCRFVQLKDGDVTPPPAGRPWVATSAAWQCDGSVRHLVWEKACGRILGKSWNWLVNFIDFSRIVLNFHIFPGYFLEFVLISCPWPKMVCSGDVLDPRQLRMEIAIKYFVMTELFVCNFVCRCFFWEESNLAPCRQRKNTASEHFFSTLWRGKVVLFLFRVLRNLMGKDSSTARVATCLRSGLCAAVLCPVALSLEGGLDLCWYLTATWNKLRLMSYIGMWLLR